MFSLQTIAITEYELLALVLSRIKDILEGELNAGVTF